MNEHDHPQFGEIRYFFKLPLQDMSGEAAFAMIDLYSAPDWDLLAESSNTLWSCSRQPNESGLCIIPITDIQSVVAMVPHPDLQATSIIQDFRNRVFVVEKMGLDVMQMAGVTENMEADNVNNNPDVE